MALMLGRLYEALKSANVPEDQARAAAEEVATYEQVKADTWLLKWMVGVLVAMVLGLFWTQWQIIGRLASIEEHLKTVELRLTAVEQRLTTVDERLGGMEARLGAIEAGLPRP
jgi:hypothetical protein